MSCGRNHFGQFQRGGDEKPLTDERQSRRDREVARVTAQSEARLGPAYDANAVAVQRLFLVKSGLMPASQVFAHEPFRPSPRKAGR